MYPYETVSSTNDIAKELAEKGEPEGAVVIANEQYAGRGRMGRKWFSPANKGIWCSIIFRPSMNIKHANKLTMMTSVAIAQVMENIIGTPSNKVAQ